MIQLNFQFKILATEANFRVLGYKHRLTVTLLELPLKGLVKRKMHLQFNAVSQFALCKFCLSHFPSHGLHVQQAGDTQGEF